MRSNRMRVFVTGIAAIVIGIYAETGVSGEKSQPKSPVDIAVGKGIKWLVSVQGNDGGWGQDGGETSYVRKGERLESNGNDVANTAVAAQALLHAGSTPNGGDYSEALQRAVRFILERVEQSPTQGLAVTELKGTQIQRKLGPYIDTFLTSKLLAELDGNMENAKANARVRRSLEKCVAKIEKNQLTDGSWNVAGGWAPILGTSLASQSLSVGSGKGVAVNQMAMDRVEVYSENAGRTRSFSAPTASSTETVTVSAGVPLYMDAQQLEQFSRLEAYQRKNAPKIAEIKSHLSDPRFIAGFGSIGGEEFSRI